METDSITALFNTPIPPCLWHYTSVAGSMGIVSSKSIWATDVRCLNDTEEFTHIRRILQQCIEDAPEVGEFGFQQKFTIEWVVTELLKSDFMNPDSAQIFVASFSEAGNDLHQWQHYTHDNNGGVSLGFDLHRFRPPPEMGSAATLAPCVYDPNQKAELVREALEYFVKESRAVWINAVQQLIEDLNKTGVKPTSEQMAEFATTVYTSQEFTDAAKTGLFQTQLRIFRLAGLFKHDAFHHEQEWRLVLPISPGKDKTSLVQPIQIRKGQMIEEIPYIAFPLGIIKVGGDPNDVKLPIVDVMLGPTSSETSVTEYNDFLKSENISVTGHRSKIPFRRL